MFFTPKKKEEEEERKTLGEGNHLVEQVRCYCESFPHTLICNIYKINCIQIKKKFNFSNKT